MPDSLQVKITPNNPSSSSLATFWFRSIMCGCKITDLLKTKCSWCNYPVLPSSRKTYSYLYTVWFLECCTIYTCNRSLICGWKIQRSTQTKYIVKSNVGRRINISLTTCFRILLIYSGWCCKWYTCLFL